MSAPLNRHQIKLVCYGLYRGNYNSNQAFCNLKESDHEFKPDRTTVYRWFKEFARGIFKFEDKPRSGRRVTKSNRVNILRVKKCIEENNKSSITTIAKLTGLTRFTVWNILKQKLKMKKYRSVFVPRNLSASQKIARKKWCDEMIEKCEKNVDDYFDRIQTEDESYLFFETVYLGNEKRWLYPNEDYPRQFKFNRYTYKKRMFFLCFNRRAMVHISYQPAKSAANTGNYIEQIESIISKSQLDPSEVIIHHDNAPIHRSNLVQSFLKNNRIEQTGHPPYSPDLAPNDFWLIRKIKISLRDEIYRTEDELLEKVVEITNSIPEEEFTKCFDRWLERMKKCSRADGNWFEYKKRNISRNK